MCEPRGSLTIGCRVCDNEFASKTDGRFDGVVQVIRCMHWMVTPLGEHRVILFRNPFNVRQGKPQFTVKLFRGSEAQKAWRNGLIAFQSCNLTPALEEFDQLCADLARLD